MYIPKSDLVRILEGPNAITAWFQVNFLQITFGFLQKFSP